MHAYYLLADRAVCRNLSRGATPPAHCDLEIVIAEEECPDKTEEDSKQ